MNPLEKRVPQTQYERAIRESKQILEDTLTEVVSQEYSRAWRDIQSKVRRVDAQRNKTWGTNSTLRKANYASGNIWEMLKSRLQARLVIELKSGALTLAMLSAAKLKVEKSFDFDPEAFVNNLLPEIGERITHAVTTLKRIVGKKILGWYNSPDVTYQDLVDDLKPQFGVNKAALIAQQEVAVLNMKVQEHLGQQLELRDWWWSSHQDQLVCKKPILGPDGKMYNGCRALHGKVFTSNMRMPPDGSHIGCVLPGQIVSVPGLSAATKSFYKGRVITVRTRNGRELTITPNHPILTSKGYIAAKFLHEGDYVVTHFRPELIASAIDPDYQHIPSLIENVFNTLNVSRNSRHALMPTSPEYFYGDGGFIDGNINIVYTDRKLANAKDSPILQQSHEFTLHRRRMGMLNKTGICMFYSLFQRSVSVFGSYMSTCHLILSNFRSHLRPFELFRFGLSSDMNLMGNENFPNKSSIRSIFNRKLQFRNPGYIVGNDKLMRQIFPFGLTSDGNIIFPQGSTNNVDRKMGLARSFMQRESQFIQLDQIINITFSEYSGHVYDLQSDLYSLYTINGVVASNCRCDGIWIVPKTLRPPVERPIVGTEHLIKVIRPDQDSKNVLLKIFEESQHPRDQIGEFTTKDQIWNGKLPKNSEWVEGKAGKGTYWYMPSDKLVHFDERFMSHAEFAQQYLKENQQEEMYPEFKFYREGGIRISYGLDFNIQVKNLDDRTFKRIQDVLFEQFHLADGLGTGITIDENSDGKFYWGNVGNVLAASGVARGVGNSLDLVQKIQPSEELEKVFEESKHPRKGKGAGGGEFTSKGGGGADETRSTNSKATQPSLEGFSKKTTPDSETVKVMIGPKVVGGSFKGTPSNPKGDDSMSQYQLPDGSWTPEREVLHKQIIESFFRGKTPVDHPISYILGGGPASGKSTLINSGLISLPKNMVSADADAIKAMLPEYQEGTTRKDPNIAPFCHEESSYLSKAVAAKAAKEGYNILMDGTGDTSIESMTKKVNSMRTSKQEVHGIYVTCDVETAVARSKARAEQTGRSVPEAVIREDHKNVSIIFPQLIKAGILNQIDLFDTSSGKAKLLASGKGNHLEITDSEGYQKFLDKGNVLLVKVEEKQMGLSSEEIEMLVTDVMLGRKPRVTGVAADIFVIHLKQDIKEAKEKGWTLELPFEIPDIGEKTKSDKGGN
jgi:predicted ABC-type ATPase